MRKESSGSGYSHGLKESPPKLFTSYMEKNSNYTAEKSEDTLTSDRN